MAFLDTVDDLLLGPATRLILDGVKSLFGATTTTMTTIHHHKIGSTRSFTAVTVLQR